ncbi:hypothetical protein RM574_07605 [Streptomyces sp. DSM 41982]|uniref:Uncharacterized protein n=1 Tax=Streptomyces evansiae TaxID=3075535 RepID=A0ABD5E1Y9_9ACTN|nr:MULTISPECIES: hypothetical protein [unclassified Streptomyces]MDT0415355.1 hypothetical protein [Streptomyces sp. DSM 41982]SCE14696.1 hypothetical protein GA0115246_1114213 [Streptomyces sp. SolWspMP-sol7th]
MDDKARLRDRDSLTTEQAVREATTTYENGRAHVDEELGLGIVVVVAVGLFCGWYFVWRGVVRAGEMCRGLPPGTAIAETLNRVLPRSSAYDFQERTYDVDPASRDYRTVCVVADDAHEELLRATVDTLRSLDPGALEGRVWLKGGRDKDYGLPEAGISAKVNTWTAMILVPCTPGEKGDSEPTSLHVSLLLGRPLQVSDQEARSTLLSLTEALVRQAHADASACFPRGCP